MVAECDWSYSNVQDAERESFFVFWSMWMQITAMWKTVWETDLSPLVQTVSADRPLTFMLGINAHFCEVKIHTKT